MNDLSSVLKCIQMDAGDDLFSRGVISAYLFQKQQNPIYREYVELLGKNDVEIDEITDIPFLPVSFFREHTVIAGGKEAEVVFRSSAVTGARPSLHHVAFTSLYQKSITESFRFAFGKPAGYTFLALLPSYLERKNVSLVHMLKELMRQSQEPLNGFYLDEYSKLAMILQRVSESGQPCIFIGVTFAMLDFAGKYPMSLGENITVMETGGMKGRSNDIPRAELHGILGNAFGKESIAGEYGMTELLSQSYSVSQGIYKPPPWVRVFARDIHDPFNILEPGQSGALNVIDLANIYSCPFIATDDTGTVFPDGSFVVTGRVSDSDIRGCNLMV